MKQKCRKTGPPEMTPVSTAIDPKTSSGCIRRHNRQRVLALCPATREPYHHASPTCTPNRKSGTLWKPSAS